MNPDPKDEPADRLPQASAPAVAVEAAVETAPAPAPPPRLAAMWKIAFLLLAVVAGAGLFLAWTGQQRLKAVEQELIKRQQDLGERAGEARTLARQAEATTRDAAARVAVLEARLAELAIQRSQVDDMLRSLIATREESLLADIEAALRAAVQYAAITGNLEPLASALTQADERLSRSPRPRLELVRLAVAKDLDRIRSASALDLPGLTVRLDEMVRVVDDLPLVAAIDRRGVRERRTDRTDRPEAAEAAPLPATADAQADAGGSAPGGEGPWPRWLDEGLRAVFAQAWAGVRDLVRVTRVDDPQAVLLAPEQAFFLRENLKLRLLNARLALLSRQFDIARADLADAGALMERYFDKTSRRVTAALEQLRQMSAQAVQTAPPRADDTLAALAAAMAGTR